MSLGSCSAWFNLVFFFLEVASNLHHSARRQATWRKTQWHMVDSERRTKQTCSPVVCAFILSCFLFSQSYSSRGRTSEGGPGTQSSSSDFLVYLMSLSSVENPMESLAENHSSVEGAKEGEVEILFNSFSFSFHSPLPRPPPPNTHTHTPLTPPSSPPHTHTTNQPNKPSLTQQRHSFS